MKKLRNIPLVLLASTVLIACRFQPEVESETEPPVETTEQSVTKSEEAVIEDPVEERSQPDTEVTKQERRTAGRN